MFNKLFRRHATKERRSDKWIFGTMLAFGIVGLISAFVLTVEKIHLLKNPDAILSCSVNIAINCSTVMQTWQAELFGFPNSLIGLMGFSVVITVAVAGLFGVAFPKLFMLLANAGYLLGAVFAYWLFFQSVYVIQVLCPWCLVVTFGTTILLSVITVYNLRRNAFGLSKTLNKTVQAFLDKGYEHLIVASWLVLMVILVVIKFGDGLFA